MSEPDFSSQTAERLTFADSEDWFRRAAENMKAKGATYIRRTKLHDVHKGRSRALYLVEGWKEKPAVVPEPDFAFTAEPAL